MVSERGVEQGDPWGSFLFALGLVTAIAEVAPWLQEHAGGRAVLIALLDDLSVVAPLRTLAAPTLLSRAGYAGTSPHPSNDRLRSRSNDRVSSELTGTSRFARTQVTLAPEARDPAIIQAAFGHFAEGTPRVITSTFGSKAPPSLWVSWARPSPRPHMRDPNVGCVLTEPPPGLSWTPASVRP